MKEIKFRIWDKEDNEMNYLSLQDIAEDDIWFDGVTSVWAVMYDCNNDNERFIANQFTGLKDKNGNDIYEGDIIKNTITKINFDDRSGEYKEHLDKYESIDVVNFDEHWCCFKFTKKSERGEFEIIGNIHQNQELLNK